MDKVRDRIFVGHLNGDLEIAYSTGDDVEEELQEMQEEDETNG